MVILVTVYWGQHASAMLGKLWEGRPLGAVLAADRRGTRAFVEWMQERSCRSHRWPRPGGCFPLALEGEAWFPWYTSADSKWVNRMGLGC